MNAAAMQLRLAWSMMIASVIGWPTSILWWATSEPPAVLSLSWLALIYAAVTAIFAAHVRRRQEEEADTSE